MTMDNIDAIIVIKMKDLLDPDTKHPIIASILTYDFIIVRSHYTNPHIN